VPTLCFSSSSRLVATIELGAGPVADIEVTELPDGQLSVELAGLETGVRLVGSRDVIVGLIIEADRVLTGRRW